MYKFQYVWTVKQWKAGVNVFTPKAGVLSLIPIPRQD